jgi:hypothetical protein
MNVGLFRSRHALVAGALVAVLAAWHAAADQPFGSRDAANGAYLLVTGWLGFALFLVLAAYAVRRAAHRLRLSPEFGWKVPLRNLEAAGAQVNELQNRVTRRELTGIAAVRREACAILRRHGVHRVLRVEVQRDPHVLGALRVVTLPREPLGRLASWLHAHVYYGAAAAFVVWFHGGLRTGSTLGLLLNVGSGIVLATGAVGIVLWSLGPTWLTRAERELSLEKVWALRGHLRRKLAAVERAVQETTGGHGEVHHRRDLAVLGGQRKLLEAEWRRLARFRLLLRGWRIVHVPASILLLALVGVHVLAVSLY